MAGHADIPIVPTTQQQQQQQPGIDHHPRSRSPSITKDADVENEGPIALDSTNAVVPEHRQQGGFALEYRPPVDYSSFGAFFSSAWARFKSLWTKRFTFALLVST